MKKFTFKERLSYWFDNRMARGSLGLIKVLFLFSLILILAVAGVITAFRLHRRTAPHHCPADQPGAGQDARPFLYPERTVPDLQGDRHLCVAGHQRPRRLRRHHHRLLLTGKEGQHSEYNQPRDEELTLESGSRLIVLSEN